MTNHEQNQKPENLDVEYSGPHPGDARDPNLIGELLPQIATEIAQAAHTTELGAAHLQVLELEGRRAVDSASVTDVELQAAKSALLQLRRQDSARFLRRLPD